MNCAIAFAERQIRNGLQYFTHLDHSFASLENICDDNNEDEDDDEDDNEGNSEEEDSWSSDEDDEYQSVSLLQ